MKRRTLALFSVSALVAGVLACSSANPASPLAPAATGTNAAADGSTLKSDAPGALSPTNDQKLTSPVVNLTATAATLQFPTATPVTLQYRFQVFNAAGAIGGERPRQRDDLSGGGHAEPQHASHVARPGRVAG